MSTDPKHGEPKSGDAHLDTKPLGPWIVVYLAVAILGVAVILSSQYGNWGILLWALAGGGFFFGVIAAWLVYSMRYQLRDSRTNQLGG